MRITKAIIIRHDDPLSRRYAAECAETCVRYGVKFDYLDGFDPSFVSPRDFQEKTGLSFKNVTFKEALVFASHAKAWSKIAMGTTPTAILEHDVLLRHPLDGFEISSRDVTYLGLRVESRSDYEYPGGEPGCRSALSFEGAHAYAVSASTAAGLFSLTRGYIDVPVDEFIRKVQNAIYVVDPPVAVAEVGNGRESTVMKRSIRTNFLPFPGFFRGLLRTAAKKYVIDGGNGWLKF